jgi:hypothetical protein
VPILNASLSAEAVDAKGNKKTLPPATALIARGPVLEVIITAAPPITQTILAAGGKLPDPIKGYALIDTGASGTCIDDDVAVALSLPVTGTAIMTSASLPLTSRIVKLTTLPEAAAHDAGLRGFEANGTSPPQPQSFHGCLNLHVGRHGIPA